MGGDSGVATCCPRPALTFKRWESSRRRRDPRMSETTKKGAAGGENEAGADDPWSLYNWSTMKIALGSGLCMDAIRVRFPLSFELQKVRIALFLGSDFCIFLRVAFFLTSRDSSPSVTSQFVPSVCFSTPQLFGDGTDPRIAGSGTGVPGQGAQIRLISRRSMIAPKRVSNSQLLGGAMP